MLRPVMARSCHCCLTRLGKWGLTGLARPISQHPRRCALWWGRAPHRRRRTAGSRLGSLRLSLRRVARLSRAAVGLFRRAAPGGLLAAPAAVLLRVAPSTQLGAQSSGLGWRRALFPLCLSSLRSTRALRLLVVHQVVLAGAGRCCGELPGPCPAPSARQGRWGPRQCPAVVLPRRACMGWGCSAGRGARGAWREKFDGVQAWGGSLNSQFPCASLGPSCCCLLLHHQTVTNRNLVSSRTDPNSPSIRLGR